MEEIIRMQYEQLLEIHKSYFTVFIHVLSIYLAVMAWCAKAVYVNEKKVNRDKSESTFPSILVFALVASMLFMFGLWFGLQDAGQREQQISNVAKELGIQPVGVALLENVIWTMMFGTGFFIVIWLVLLVLLWKQRG